MVDRLQQHKVLIFLQKRETQGTTNEESDKQGSDQS